MERRHLLIGALTSAASTTIALQTSALRRPTYGGKLRLALPLRLRSLDPHDPEDLACSFFGRAIFETLFASTSDGRVYPTLASSLPEKSGNRLQIKLRPHLLFASGKSLTAEQVVASIKRSQERSPALRAIGVPTWTKKRPDEISLPLGDPNQVAATLSHERAALLPSDYDPTRPDSCGALQVTQTGLELHLKRNLRASRGGSFLDEVVIQSASVANCLRAFEARRSDLGFLGAGLHQMRKDVVPFRTSSLGVAIVKPGQLLERFARPGVLHDSLARLPHAPFASLGVVRERSAVHPWPGPEMDVIVSEEEPWLCSLADELASAWTTPNAPVAVSKLSEPNFATRIKRGDFHAALSAYSYGGRAPSELTAELFALDGKSAPQSGRTLSPLIAARQLSLGILGELIPQGSLARDTLDLTTQSGLDLAQAQVRP